MASQQSPLNNDDGGRPASYKTPFDEHPEFMMIPVAPLSKDDNDKPSSDDDHK
jgi:hypothetical protein